MFANSIEQTTLDLSETIDMDLPADFIEEHAGIKLPPAIYSTAKELAVFVNNARTGSHTITIEHDHGPLIVTAKKYGHDCVINIDGLAGHVVCTTNTFGRATMQSILRNAIGTQIWKGIGKAGRYLFLTDLLDNAKMSQIEHAQVFAEVEAANY